ncbi:MAG: hypothetical protein ACLTSX_00940 [Collinsella sp.]
MFIEPSRADEADYRRFARSCSVAYRQTSCTPAITRSCTPASPTS